jgi:hypothetical protein
VHLCVQVCAKATVSAFVSCAVCHRQEELPPVGTLMLQIYPPTHQVYLKLKWGRPASRVHAVLYYPVTPRACMRRSIFILRVVGKVIAFFAGTFNRVIGIDAC